MECPAASGGSENGSERGDLRGGGPEAVLLQSWPVGQVTTARGSAAVPDRPYNRWWAIAAVWLVCGVVVSIRDGELDDVLSGAEPAEHTTAAAGLSK